MKNKEILKISQTGQWSIDSVPSDESLEKKLKNLAAATALLANISNINPDQIVKPNKDPEIPTKIERQLHPDLDHIAFIESSSGKNLDHSTVTWGLNRGHKAGGQFGIMPITAKEVVEKNPSLREKYSHMLSMNPSAITNYLNTNDDASKDIASAHWTRLLKIFPKDRLKRVYAWNNGITGALRASPEEIKSHPYVKKFVSSSSNRKIASKNGARD